MATAAKPVRKPSKSTRATAAQQLALFICERATVLMAGHHAAGTKRTPQNVVTEAVKLLTESQHQVAISRNGERR